MNPHLHEQLIRLKAEAQSSQDSELSIWLREMLVRNITNLLEENVSDLRVQDTLRGGMRAICDAESLYADDPIVNLLGAILEDRRH
jgi:hypothetical protein